MLLDPYTATGFVGRPLCRPTVYLSQGMNIATAHTPVGPLGICTNGAAVVRIEWGEQTSGERTPLLCEAIDEITAYFAGRLRRFTVPVQPDGGSFQQQVCAAMMEIPFGETLTYGEIARRIGSAAQPVGNACGANSIPVIIPCHRVLGAGGLGGYSGRGGVETKIALLKHEGAFPYLL